MTSIARSFCEFIALNTGNASGETSFGIPTELR